MQNKEKTTKNKDLSREESIKKVVFEIYVERKKNSDREEEIRIKRIRDLTKGKKIEIDNSKGDSVQNRYTAIEAQ
jgi:hypothetical protein